MRRLAWAEPAVDVLRLGAFVLFVALGLFVARRRLAAQERRARVDRLLIYVLLLTTAVGLVQQESWPFTTWSLVQSMASRHGVSWEMEGLDRGGASYRIDPRILQPLPTEDFGAWLLAHADRLPPEGRARVGRFVLEQAEAARVRYRSGQPVARNSWLLGPLTAPYHFHYGRTWKSVLETPATPFITVRVWRLDWDIEERAAAAHGIARRLILEFPGRS